MVETKYKIINEFLLKDDPSHWKIRENKWGFCLHSSVLEDLEKIKQQFSITTEWEIINDMHTLQIGDAYYSMNIIYVTLDYKEEHDILRELIKNSQFSFPWEDNANLFINVRSFHILEQFILNNNLKASILRVDEKRGITANGEIIKVVTFNQSVSAKILIRKYEAYLNFAETYHRPYYYYMTYVFPWLQPRWVDNFNIPINNQFHLVFPVILWHLRTLNYTNKLTMLDLLSIRLALCDFRNPVESNNVKFEIDYMIKRELKEIVQKKHLDLERYANDKKYVPRDVLINYLVYEFQNHFETVKTVPRDTFQPKLGPDKPNSIIELAHERDIFRTLHEKRNTQFFIDGLSFDKMSFSLFLDLVKYDNVLAIRLDTNFKWLQNGWDINRTVSYTGGRIYVFLVGTNTYKFIEDFVSSLKTMPFTMKVFSLHIYCSLSNYRIFHNLKVYRIDFHDIQIDRHMLESLEKCDLKTMIRIYNCTFENSRHNWALLDNLNKLNYVKIHENEGTWESLFEFISDELFKSNSNEFQFNRKTLVVSGDRTISFVGIKFTVDKVNSKLLIWNTNSKQVIDLYDLKFELKPDDIADYEFYQ